MVTSAPLGFSITSGLKSVGKGIIKAHVIGTKALISAAKNKQVQQAAIQAGQSYAQSKYGSQYATAAGLYSRLRPPPGAAVPTPADDGSGDDGGDVPPGPPGARMPVQKGNLMLIGGLVAAGILVIVLTR